MAGKNWAIGKEEIEFSFPFTFVVKFMHNKFFQKMAIYGSHKEKIAYFISRAIINSGGLIINILASHMFLKYRRTMLSSNNNKLLFSLVVADILVSLFGIADAILFYSATNGNISSDIWKLVGILPLFGSFFTSILALGIMSYDRLISVVYPLRYNIIMTTSMIKLCIISTWLILAFILTIQCTLFLSTSSTLEKMVRSYLLATFFVTGSITLMIANCKLYMVIQRKRRNIAAQFHVSSNSIVSRETQGREAGSQVQKENVSNSLICIWMTAIFIFCWLPITVYYVIRRNGYPGSRTFSTIVTCLASFNSFLNPLVYLIKRKTFRKHFAKFR